MTAPMSPPAPPSPVDPTASVAKKLKDLIAQTYFGYADASTLFKKSSNDVEAQYRSVLGDIVQLFNNPEKIIQNMQQDRLTGEQARLLEQLVYGQTAPTAPAAPPVGTVPTQVGSLAGIKASGPTNIKLTNLTYGPGNSQPVPVTDTPGIIDAFISSYVSIYASPTTSATGGNRGGTTTTGGATDTQAKLRSSLIYKMIDEYKKYKSAKDATAQAKVDPFNYISSQLKQVGSGFVPSIDYLDTSTAMRNVMLRSGKFREDTQPLPVAPWECRIGAAKFYVPPVNIRVSQQFKTGSLTGAVLRQQNSPKFNTGHSETNIEMTLYFPNHETIWGYSGDTAQFNWDPNPIIDKEQAKIAGLPDPGEMTSDSVVDAYLSSLRGLITQFKYAPFLPVRNQYLNQAHDIHAVTMLDMTIQTYPGFPFCLVVTLTMAKFNHKAYLPMLDDFEQAIHWGKFRQYMGRATNRLDSVVNQGFLIDKLSPGAQQVQQDAAERAFLAAGPDARKNWKWPTAHSIVQYEGDLNARFDKVQDISDGRYFEIYYPRTTPSRIFSPDVSDFRQPGEDEIISREKWGGILDAIGIHAVDQPENYYPFEYDTAYEDGRLRSERFILHEWLDTQGLMWENMNSEKMAKFLEDKTNDAIRSGGINADNASSYRDQLKFAWFTEIYASYLINKEGGFAARIRDAQYSDGEYLLKEWKVPMEKVLIDWSSVVIDGISVSMSNNIARLQLQMQDEPTHQHIGGGDTVVQVAMTVLGEVNLVRFRRVFEHITGLARLEQGHGVLGFLGIKNVVTALCGCKYVIPQSFEVDTIEGYPHAYSVTMNFIDFDVLQQKREELSSNQQADLINAFGKRNPFLRLKQQWGAFNAYPDLPLSVRDEEGNVVSHLDADWYFRSFETKDPDITDWQINTDIVSKLAVLRQFDAQMPNQSDPNYASHKTQRDNLNKEISDLITKAQIELPAGFSIDTTTGEIKSNNTSTNTLVDTTKLRTFLGTFGEDQNKLHYLEQDKAGSLSLGSQDLTTGKDDQQFLSPHTFAEDLASKNGDYIPPIEGTVPPKQYQHEYWNKSDSPVRQFEVMMKDWKYRQLDGRMIRAFPTYMLWLIDEGGRFAGIKLFDNFYGLSSVVDFSVVASEDPMSDTLVLRVSNLYQRLSTPFKESIIAQDDPLLDTPIGRIITTAENRNRNLLSGLTNELVTINNIRLKPGVRVHLRMGYSANPNALQTVFNGVITQVEDGDIMTIIAQSDAVELSAYVNTTNSKGHSGSLDGGINTGFWMSEPRDLMVRLMSMGSSAFKEWISWATKGVIFSDNRFGIRHFGSILYEPMTDKEAGTTIKRQIGVSNAMAASTKPGSNDATLTENLGTLSDSLSNLNFGSFTAIFNGNMIAIMEAMWVNQFKKRDYELFKRNIYPGNGLGIAQFMAGDMIDAGVIIATSTALTKTPDTATTPGLTPATGPILTPTAAQIAEANKAIIDSTKDILNQSPSDDKAIAGFINANDFIAPDVTVGDNTASGGIWGYVKGAISTIGEVYEWTSPISWTKKVFGWAEDTPLGGVPILGSLLHIGSVASGYVSAITQPFAAQRLGFSLVKKTLQSPLFRAFGLTSAMDDEDLPGYDEVSFRAQTYMQTIWDMFELCAALLPNYIVAVRPFEDRSTVFYGKPHWLYTSGVIPVSSGVPRTGNPKFEGADHDLTQLTRIASQNLSSFDEIQRQLNDIAKFDRSFTYADTMIAAAAPGTAAGAAAASAVPGTVASGVTDPNIAAGAKITPSSLTTGLMGLMGVGGTAAPGAYDPSDPLGWKAIAAGLPVPTPPAGTVGVSGAIGGAGGSGTIDPRLIYDYFLQNGVSPATAAGILANMEAESGFRTSVVGDNGTSGGLFQHHAGRWTNLKNYAASTNRAWDDWKAQVDFALIEAKSYNINLQNTDAAAAAIEWAMKFEKMSGGMTSAQKRAGNVGKYMFGGTASPMPPGVPQNGPGGTQTITAAGTTIVVRNVPISEWSAKVKGQLEAEITAAEKSRAGAFGPIAQGISTGINAKRQQLALLQRDPVVFAYHFGWRYADIPSYIGIESGYGVDIVGVNARKIYDQDLDGSLDQLKDRKQSDTEDIWQDFRNEYRSRPETRQMYDRVFPTTEGQGKYNQIFDMFLRFMWQIPSHRSWLVLNVDKQGDSLAVQGANAALAVVTLGNPIASVGGGTNWSWANVDPVWEAFLTSRDITINANNVPFSPAADAYMQSHNTPGSNANNIVTQALDNLKNWFDTNIGDFFGALSDTITTVITMIRTSLMQLGFGLNIAASQQRQANILNQVFNDSMYYQEGTEDSLLRYIDNPFTREYGEPVVEIREPFQRAHFLSSFQHILDNGISENLNGVATVITATSDGKYPVTVHFDKGIPPERQVERNVETGLYWDNAVGSGITGMFHPFIHPIETLRSTAKNMTGSSDLLSARRVALYHLKEGLKDIYTGELLILGNPDIRAHDLIYLGDVYSRMYGMFEVEKVIHHFTPDMGFVTSITPNAIVTINDPARWSLISWMWRKWADHNIRNDTRSMLAIKADRNALLTSPEGLDEAEIPNMYSTQLLGGLQYTQGNTALIRDLAGLYNMGGMKGLTQADEAANNVAKIDMQMLMAKQGLAVGGAVAGGALIATGVGAPAGIAVAAGGWAVGDILWKAWQWVKDNLLDQHGCYIQYLNKDGQPMDAGLSYFQGVAVGQHHSINLFPSILGLSGRVNTTNPDGRYRITTNDILSSLGWSEIETTFLQRDTSWFVNQINNEVLRASGRSPDPITSNTYSTAIAEVVNPFIGEGNFGDGKPKVGVEDGDTLNVRIIKSSGGFGGYETVRLLVVNTAELLFHDNAETAFDETTLNLSGDLGFLARKYLVAKFTDPKNRTIALRINPREPRDLYGRLLAVVFCNVPPGTPLDAPASVRGEILEGFAKRDPIVPWDGYMEDGRPYSLNWELVMAGYGNVDMRNFLWDSTERIDQIADVDRRVGV